MASKSKSKAKAATAMNELLKAIVAATLQNSFVYHNAEAVASLLADGMVEQNTAMNDGQGGIATRATQKGIDTVNNSANQTQTGTDTLTAGDVGTVSAEQLAGNGGGSDFVIQDDVPVPAITGRGRGPGTSVYPFDKLVKVGQSFFVEKAAKNLASTVSGANARFSEVVNGPNGQPLIMLNRKKENVPVRRYTRQFIVRSVTENGVKGSRVWRVEPKNEHVDAALKAASQPAAASTLAPTQGQAWGQ